MSIVATNFNNSTAGLNPEAEKQARYLKKVSEHIKDVLEEKIKAYSKRADGSVTGIGTQLRGVGKKRDNAVFAFFGSSPLLTLSLLNNFDNDARQALQNMKDWFKFTAITAPSVAVTPSHVDLTNAFSVKVQLENINESLALKFKEHVEAEKTNTKLVAENIANDEFVGPLRQEMQTLRFAFADGILSKDDFVGKATKTLLEYNGIIFSADETDRFALSRSKFETLRNEFGSPSSEKVVPIKTATISLFNDAVTATAPEVERPAPQLKVSAPAFAPRFAA